MLHNPLRMFAALLAFVVCGASLAQQKFAVAVIPGATFELPAVVGVKSDIFKRHGLDVELILITGGGPQLIAALVSRSVDVTGVSADQIMVANSKGQNIKVIADTYPRALHVWMATKGWATPNASKDYPANFADLKGARIGITARGAQQELLTVMMAKEAGLNPATDMSFIAVGAGPTAIAAFKAKQVDVLAAFEPVPTALQVAGEGPKIMLDSRTGKGPAFFRSWTTYGQNALTSSLNSRPDVFQRYVNGYRESISFMQDRKNLNAVLEMAKTWLPTSLGEDVIRQLVESELPRFGAVYNCTAHDNLVKYLNDTGQLPKASAPACRDLVWQGAPK